MASQPHPSYGGGGADALVQSKIGLKNAQPPILKKGGFFVV